VMVFCTKEGKGKDQNEIPDLAIEVTSPYTRSRDYILKLSKYMASGMSEYWVVDPQKERITVYLFEEEVITKHYGLNDKIPVSIWDGKCVVDLSEAKRKISLSEELKAQPDFADEAEEPGGDDGEGTV
ncbi:MAG: Uma2 family endonuclease, partial [Firmicutes bacterium]|nr:Uma2 family endonuclease [Bacillota bacterium]